jgi:DNA-binding response OmpR family regulator
MKILVVDDDDVWVKVVTRYFTHLKYEVFSSYAWAGALALAEQHVPEVILVDGSLPDGTPSDFCAAIRANAKFKKTALILVSGDDREEQGCKADRFVLKGGSLSEVEAAINETVKLHAS